MPTRPDGGTLAIHAQALVESQLVQAVARPPAAGALAAGAEQPALLAAVTSAAGLQSLYALGITNGIGNGLSLYLA